MALCRPFDRLRHALSHGVVMASPQKRSFNNLTVSPMYTITGIRAAAGRRGDQAARSVHHRNARRQWAAITSEFCQLEREGGGISREGKCGTETFHVRSRKLDLEQTSVESVSKPAEDRARQEGGG